MESSPRGQSEKGPRSFDQLSDQEAAFLEDYMARLEGVLDQLRAGQNASVRALLKQALRPSAWRVLLELGKAERLVDKASRPPSGGDGGAEYGRRAEAVVQALRELSEYVDRDGIDGPGASTGPGHPTQESRERAS